ncbi:MAG: thiolase domain-containing protein [Pseudomonadota bacterium]
MKKVFIVGIGQTPVSKGRDQRGRYMARDAIQAALADSTVDPSDVSALFVGNMMAGILGHQQQLGPLYADAAGLRGIESMTLEAACGSGAAAARVGYAAVAGGLHDLVVVCGMERMTQAPREDITLALATAADWELEGVRGESFISLNARLMALYMEEYGTRPEQFAPFAIAAHSNAMHNPNALLKKPLDLDKYLESRVLVPPVRIMDAPPTCDGAAALVLAGEDVVKALGEHAAQPIEIVASAVGTDSLAIDRRTDKLKLAGAEISSNKAYRQAGVGPADIDLFELHDAYTIITTLSLEAAGFAKPGEGTRLGEEGVTAIDGKLPIATMGGLKARGHPVGATGVYQLVETVQQLTGRAGENQIENAETAMVQNIGGTGATVVTHILRAQ